VRRLILAAALLAAGTRAGAEDAIQPTLLHLHLGYTLKTVQRIYPPAKDQPKWPSYIEPRGHLERVRVEASYLKKPIKNVDTVWLGFKGGKLVEIHVIYDAAFTRSHSVDAVATEWSSIYGEPRRTDDGRYWWSDGSTVLRVFSAELPTTDQGIELRTSVQIFEQDVFQRVD
jgi:hypothetical protein